MHSPKRSFKFLRIWENERGAFSIVEILVGGAILAGVAVGANQMFRDNTKIQRSIDLDQKLNGFHAVLTKIVQDPQNCNATYRHNTEETNPADPPNPPAVAVPDLGVIYLAYSSTPQVWNRYPRGDVYISIGDYIDTIPEFREGKSSKTWMITNMTFPAIDSGTPVENRVLEVTYRLDATPQNPARSVVKKIPLFLRFGDDGLFHECFSPGVSTVDNFQHSLCTSLNTQEVASDGTIAVFNPNTQRCELRTDATSLKVCPPGQVIAGLNSQGKLNCAAPNVGAETTVPDTTRLTTCIPGMRMYLRKDPGTGKMVPSCE